MKAVILPDGTAVVIKPVCVGPTKTGTCRRVNTPEEMAEFLGGSAESYRHYFDPVVRASMPKGPQ